MMKWLTSLAFLMLFGSIAGQHREAAKLPLSLQIAAADTSMLQEKAHLFLRGEAGALDSICRSLGGAVKYRFKSYSSVWLPLETVTQLNAIPQIKAVHYQDGPGLPLLDQSRVQARINGVHEGLSGLPEGLSGEGILIGLIDAGIDFNHPDFKDAMGRTRIIEIWDQNMAFDAQLTPSYGYGQVWDSASINAGECPHMDQAAYAGHGTNTTGIAAGNGASKPELKGCAPDAHIVMVSSKFNAINWTATVADAVDYILSIADSLDLPCVINLSAGTYNGSHDATDLPAQFIESRLDEAPGRILVCAAGNAGNQVPFHVGHDANGDTAFTWFTTPSNATIGNGSIFFEMFGDRDDFERVQFAIGADKISPGFAFRGTTAFDSVLNRLYIVYTENLLSSSGNYLGQVQTWADSIGGSYRVQFFISLIDSIQYRYRLQLTGHGRADLWSATFIGTSAVVPASQLPSPAQFPDVVHYIAPDNHQSIVSSWNCSDHVISVGNYTNRATYTNVDLQTVTMAGLTGGALAASSSLGPTRRNAMKPDLCAPGDVTLTAGAAFQIGIQLANNQRDRVAAGGMHNRAGGTSSASPVVAGIAALFLQHCSSANWEDFSEALLQSAYQDAFTGNTANNTWGVGKADALATLLCVTPTSGLISDGNSYCSGDTLSLALANSFPSVLWSHGQTTSHITATGTGSYYARLENEIGCVGYSDTLFVFERPLPQKPVLTLEGSNPTCANEPVTIAVEQSFGAYNWSTGAHTRSISTAHAGSYACEVVSAFGCFNQSDTLRLETWPSQSDPTIWLSAGDWLMMQHDTVTVAEYRWYLSGATLPGNDSSWQVTQAGHYQGSVVDQYGCEYRSNALFVSALGVGDQAGQLLKVFPNPAHDYVRVDCDHCAGPFVLHNIAGEPVLVSSTHRFSVAHLAPGIYVLHSGDEALTTRLVLVR